MKKKIFLALSCLFLSFGALQAENNLGSVAQPQILGGDAGTACEVILCLAAVGSPPTECAKPLAKYFAIHFKQPWKTAQARQAFLALCPKI